MKRKEEKKRQRERGNQGRERAGMWQRTGRKGETRARMCMCEREWPSEREQKHRYRRER